MNTAINDKLDLLLSLVGSECGNDDVETFNNLGTSGVCLDKSFYIRRKQILSKYKYGGGFRSAKRFLVRIAVALMALMSLGFLTVLASPDLREAVFGAVVEWYEDYFSIRYEPVTEETGSRDTEAENTDITSTEEPKTESEASDTVKPPEIIEHAMKPAYLPEGVEEEIVISGFSGIIIDYFIGDDLLFTYHQDLMNGHDVKFDSDEAQITEIFINSYSAMLIEYNDRDDRLVVWTDGLYMYYLEVFDGGINVSEIVKIAESIC
ncbi:MAG: DUF4367 domain-containing protein [Clostridia bacterium]|nr:DUF4367 domain-containing protein [Clostridia bacterium]